MNYFDVSNRLAQALAVPAESSEFPKTLKSATDAYNRVKIKGVFCRLKPWHQDAIEFLYSGLQEKVK